MNVVSFVREPDVEDERVKDVYRDVKESLRNQFAQTKPEKDVPIKICGNQPAQFTIFKAVSKSRGGEDEVHMVRTAINGSLYMAMYVRSQGDPADPTAESALKTLCPRPS